jgi:hypothetical protein
LSGGRWAVLWRGELDDNHDPDAARSDHRSLRVVRRRAEALVEDPELHLFMGFEPGDIQLVHNHQILHDRTAFEDWPEPERKRHLLRLWLCPPDGRPLPACFAARYGSVTIGDRGGIVVPDARLTVPL